MSGIITDDRGHQDLFRIVDELSRTSIWVGVLGEDKGGDMHQNADNMTVLDIAIIHEYGAPRANIPARSFIRKGFDKHRKAIENRVARGLERVLSGKMALQAFYDDVGRYAVIKFQQFLRSGEGMAPLKPETIARKGHARPLLETRQLVNSITYRVVRK